MYHFCTYFDHRYLSRGLALYSSLKAHCKGFSLHVLCLSEACHDTLKSLNLPNLHPISMDEFEAGDCALLEAKQNRSLVEYYFTCTPSLPLYVLKHFPQADMVTYLDADMYFFGDPAAIFEEMGDNAIAIVAHRFPERVRYRERYGIYNVGILAFRRDAHGLACLMWWRERCLEWCYDREEDGRFADQKYLDDWPTRFQGVIVLSHKGVNTAPWNLENHEMSLQDGKIMVGDQPLILFHFHGLKRKGTWTYDPGVALYETKISSLVRKKVYHPYIDALSEAAEALRRVSAGSEKVDNIRASTATATESLSGLRLVKRRVKTLLQDCKKVADGEYILVGNGRAI